MSEPGEVKPPQSGELGSTSKETESEKLEKSEGVPDKMSGEPAPDKAPSETVVNLKDSPGKKGILYWLNKAWVKFLAILAVVVLLVTFWEKLLDLHHYIVTPHPLDTNVTLGFSLALPYCQNGDIGAKLARWPSGYVPNLTRPVQNMRLCINQEIRSTYRRAPEQIVLASSGCLALSDDPEQLLTANLASPAVCRASYRPDRERGVVPSSPEQGFYLCIPGLQENGGTQVYSGDGVDVRICPREVLEGVRFFGSP